MGDNDQPQLQQQVERLKRTRTHDELYEEANLLKIEGRSEMSDEQLAAEICKAR